MWRRCCCDAHEGGGRSPKSPRSTSRVACRSIKEQGPGQTAVALQMRIQIRGRGQDACAPRSDSSPRPTTPPCEQLQPHEALHMTSQHTWCGGEASALEPHGGLCKFGLSARLPPMRTTPAYAPANCCARFAFVSRVGNCAHCAARCWRHNSPSLRAAAGKEEGARLQPGETRTQRAERNACCLGARVAVPTSIRQDGQRPPREAARRPSSTRGSHPRRGRRGPLASYCRPMGVGGGIAHAQPPPCDSRSQGNSRGSRLSTQSPDAATPTATDNTSRAICGRTAM